ncbi:MAG: MucB/RseB C-terminal domain-containing protein [Gammaproteobacteria bacterium]
MALCLLTLQFLLSAPTLAADALARQMLRDMHEATRMLNYDGVFVYQRSHEIDSMRLVHQYADGDEKERLISLSGPAREVIRDGELVTCVFADDQAAMVEKSQPRDLIGIGFSAPVETLEKNYQFTLGNHERVAGRDAQIITIEPESEDRYAYRLWIDSDSKLLLKSVILGASAQALEQVQFTHLEVLDTIPPARMAPELTGSGFTWRMDAGDSESINESQSIPWRVDWIPNGFTMEDHKVQNMATSEMPVGHLVYSDGLAMVSVFIEKLMPDATPMQGFSSRGAVNAFSRVAEEHQITVVGELPLQTVRRIAGAVVRTSDE